MKREDLEARLFFNNQLVTSTDDGGTINDGSTFQEQRNHDSCYEHTEVCQYTLWSFKWKNFRVESLDRERHPNNQDYARSEPAAVYTRDKPGEYAVKIFYKRTAGARNEIYCSAERLARAERFLRQSADRIRRAVKNNSLDKRVAGKAVELI